MKFLKCLLIESFIIFYVPEECAWNIISYTVFLFPNSLILFPFKLFLPLLFRFTLLFFSKWNAFYIYFSAFYLVKKKLNFLEYSFSLKWKVFVFFFNRAFLLLYTLNYSGDFSLTQVLFKRVHISRVWSPESGTWDWI